MTKDEFIEKKEKFLKNIYKDYYFNNFSKQLLAYKLHADISKTYNLNYIWKKTLIVISTSCFLLKENLESKIALQSIYKVANILENISEIEESAKEFDLDYLRLLSALCYDIAGYQANAYCIAKKIENYKLNSEENINLDEDNIIFDLFLNALLKKIPLIRQIVLKGSKREKTTEEFDTILNAFKLWAEQILDLEESKYFELFEDAYSLYLKVGNIYISQLILLFLVRIKMYRKRSINLNLKTIIGKNSVWKKYIKLLSNDYFEAYNKIKNIDEKKSIFEFWTSQLRAINDGLLSKDESFVVQMPTSAGKTFIAELFILKHLTNTQKKVLYISPFRALASEKVDEIGKYFSYLGYKVTSSTGSYEYEPIFDTVFDDSDVYILTPEKADSILRMDPDFFDDIGAIVIDEGHIIGDLNTRAALTELLIIKLNIKYPEIKKLFISAVMPPLNASEYAKWLSGNGNNVLRSRLFKDSDIQEEWEPTRKNIGYFKWLKMLNGKYNGQIVFSNVSTFDEINREETNAFIPNYLKGDEFGIKSVNNKPATAAVLGLKMSREGNTLIFCGQVPRIESVSNRFIDIINNDEQIEQLKPDYNKESYFYSRSWYGDSHYITKCILHGIGIHFGDMPEQVRTAVENDYKNQKLKILLCTNTVGQGVNFPIKNIIFYDITVGFIQGQGQSFISHRDFWNIIGRSGRAEKETEGNIIFIINTAKDKDNYDLFIQKEAMEYSQSLLSCALELLLETRLSEDNFDTLVLDIVETFLLDMITEEVFENDEEFITNLINQSLFNVQSREENILRIHSSFHKAIKIIKDKNENVEELKEFGKTGLNLEDCLKIMDFINENLEAITRAIETSDCNIFISYFIRLITEKELKVLDDIKLNKLINENKLWDKYSNIIFAWINNEKIETIKTIWTKEISDDFEEFYILLSKGLYFLFPWLFNAFILLIAHVIKIDFLNVPEIIRYIPTFMKYGLNNKKACLARQCGIKTRETSIYLAENITCNSDKDFIICLSNLSSKVIEKMPLSSFEKENIKQVVFNVTPRSNKGSPKHFSFEIVGTGFDGLKKKNSLFVKKTTVLNLVREKDNIFDPYAILITYKNKPIGYVPREYSKYIATEIDLNNSKYGVTPIDIEFVPEENYNKIHIDVDLQYF